jgi:hypothetical protein
MRDYPTGSGSQRREGSRRPGARRPARRTGEPRARPSRTVIQPWYSSDAGGFVPRVSVLDGRGEPVNHIDGPHAFRTYAQAAEASRFLLIGAAARARRRVVIVGRTSPLVYESLQRMFADNPNVHVILDRHVRADRRHLRLTPMAVERRRAERRVRPEVDDLLRRPGRAVVVLGESQPWLVGNR